MVEKFRATILQATLLTNANLRTSKTGQIGKRQTASAEAENDYEIDSNF